MLNWDDLRFFAELARRGSLSETARRLKTDHTTVARRIASLEAALNLKLFDRLPRGYVLTAEGARIAARIGALEDAVYAIERLAGAASDAVDGTVRIAAPPAFASRWLMPRLAPLRARHPALVLDLIGATPMASLVRHEADIAVRLTQPADATLVVRRLGVLRYGLYGARAYVDATPEHKWAFLGYDAELDDVPQQCWLRSIVGDRPFAVLTNDLASLHAAARAGMGLAALPHVLVEPSDDLVCLAEGDAAARELWLVVHPDLRRSARVRVVMDHLVDITAPLRRRGDHDQDARFQGR
jgi:DNA-binding transcriptional LysR family regulator